MGNGGWRATTNEEWLYQRNAGKRRIWEQDPDNPKICKAVWVADELSEKGRAALVRENVREKKAAIKRQGSRGLTKTWTPQGKHGLILMLIATHLKRMGVDLPDPAIEVNAQATLDALFDDLTMAGEVWRRITTEDQSQALRGLPSRYLSQRGYDQLARERAKLLGWYADRVSR